MFFDTGSSRVHVFKDDFVLIPFGSIYHSRLFMPRWNLSYFIMVYCMMMMILTQIMTHTYKDCLILWYPNFWNQPDYGFLLLLYHCWYWVLVRCTHLAYTTVIFYLVPQILTGLLNTKGQFTPWTMKSDHERWPFPMVRLHGPTIMVWFLKKSIYKVFGPFIRCKPNVDHGEWPCTKKRMYWFFNICPNKKNAVLKRKKHQVWSFDFCLLSSSSFPLKKNH